MKDNHVYVWFLPSNGSIFDQPCDNGPNSSYKACYDAYKENWRNQFGNAKFTPFHMNGVLVAAWNDYTTSNKLASTIIRAFQRCGLFPFSSCAV